MVHARGDAVKEKIAPSKLYYSISEVSKIAEVKPYVLRFWERDFPMLRPKKNRSGNRIYQKKEIELIGKIKKLLYVDGYTIDGARQQLKNGRNNPGKPAKKSYARSLSNVKKELKSLIEYLS